MANPRFSNVAPTRGRDQRGGKDTTDQDSPGDSESLPSAMPMRTAAWPGVPGKANQRAPFYVKKEGV